MVLVKVKVSMIRKDPVTATCCQEVAEVTTDDMATMGQLEAQLAAKHADRASMVKLGYEGRPISLGTVLYHYLPASSNSLRLGASFQTTPAARTSSDAQVFIASSSGAVIAMQCNLAGKVDHLRQMAADTHGLAAGSVRLSFGGRQLMDGRTLMSYGITANSTLQQTISMCGGGPPLGMKFVDVTKDSALQQIPLVTNAPKWRIIGSGLNVEGICLNSSCIAFKKLVFDRKRMVTWSLLADKCSCPICSTQFQVRCVSMNELLNHCEKEQCA